MGVRVHRVVHRPLDQDAIVVDLGSGPILQIETIRPDVVFHLAARVHNVDNGAEAEADHQRITVEGTRSLLDASVRANVRSFVFFSTCAVWPESSVGILNEDSPTAPVSAYGRAKLQAEQMVLSMNGLNGMRTACLRLPLVYGPGQKGNLPRMLRAIERGFFPPWPHYGASRSYVHVDDVAEAAVVVAESPRAAGRIYLVAERRAYTTREIYQFVLTSLGRKPPPWSVPAPLIRGLARVGDVGELVLGRHMPFDTRALAKMVGAAQFSSERIQRELGFQTSRTFEASVKSLLSQNQP